MGAVWGARTEAPAAVGARIVTVVATTTCFVAFVLEVTALLRQEPFLSLVIYACALLVNGLALLLVKRGRARTAGVLVSLNLFASIAVGSLSGSHPTSTATAMTALLIITAFCWNARGTLLLGLGSSALFGNLIHHAPDLTPYEANTLWVKVSALLLLSVLTLSSALKALADAQARAVSQDKLWADLVRNAGVGVVVFDDDGRINLVNQSAREMGHIDAQASPHQSLSELQWFDADSTTRLLAGLREPKGDQRLELAGRDGLHVYEGRLSVVSWPTGKADHLLTVLDVTSERAAERARRELDARIAESKSLESLGRLAGGVAHDFNNLLTVILATTDLLQSSEGLDADVHQDLQQIEGAAVRAAELTAQLLAVARRQVLTPQNLCPNQVLENLLPLLERLLPENIDLLVKCSPELDNVQVDAARLEQVVVNLVANGRDAMPNGGKITIETANRLLDADYAANHPDVIPGPHVQLAVCDGGQGMSEETMARIFEPFFTTKAKHKGTGLGLATVHGIVRQSGGHVFVYSEPGKGTCFHIYLPSSAEQSPTSAPPPGSERPSERRPLRILLVEDQDAVRASVRRMLVALGHCVVEANSGEEALVRFEARDEHFDVLVSDVVMANLSGPELAQRLSALDPALQVLFISGYTENSIVHHGVLDDGLNFLSKPFTRDGLDAALRRLQDKPVEPDT